MIMIIDDEYWARKSITRLCSTIVGRDNVREFDNSGDAIAYAKETKIDTAIIDVLLPGFSGFCTGRSLKKIDPTINIVYLSAVDKFGDIYKQYEGDSFLLKPVSKEDIKRALKCF